MHWSQGFAVITFFTCYRDMDKVRDLPASLFSVYLAKTQDTSSPLIPRL